MPRTASVLVATDLDDTLVPHGARDLPPYTARVLADLDQTGIPVVFVTARPLRWMDQLWARVGRHGWAVLSNGAVIFDAHARQITQLNAIDPDAGLELCQVITAALPGARFAIECVDGIRLESNFPEPIPSPEAPHGPMSEVWTDPAVKLMVRCPEVEDEQLRAAVTAAVGDHATVSWSTVGLSEISAAGVDKASGLRTVCDHLGVDASAVSAFGDMPNDIPMLTWAGTGYAVANAHPSVLEIADHVTPPCADEGVAQVLEREFIRRR